MRQSLFGVLIISSLVCCAVCIHDVYNLNGWQAIALENNKAVDSIVIASDHIGGILKQPVTAFKWIDNDPEWDLYRTSFLSTFHRGTTYECHADVLWRYKTSNTTVFNTDCLSVPWDTKGSSGTGL